tara:strand:- start:681 stop:1067 length:387 start_codon:yes stop_codon:yes gene_type:complete
MDLLSMLAGNPIRINERTLSYGLGPHEEKQRTDLWNTVKKHGAYEQDANNGGAHYLPAGENPFVNQGIRCDNCVFYQPDKYDQQAWDSEKQAGGCTIVKDAGTLVNYIHPDALCKFWIIPNELMGENK